MSDQQALPIISVARQAIVNRRGETFGYEFFSMREGCVLEAMVSLFSAVGTSQVLQGKKVHVNLNEGALKDDDLLVLLPTDRVVLEVNSDLLRTSEAIYDRCVALRGRGFRLALDRCGELSELQTHLSPFDLVKMNVGERSVSQLSLDVSKARMDGLAPVAYGITSMEQAKACLNAGFPLVQGDIFAQPVVVKGQTIPTSKLVITRLIAQLNQTEVDMGEISRTIAEDLGLSYRLLRFVNSAGIAGTRRFDNITQAVIMIGTAGLMRLLGLTLFATDLEESSGPWPRALLNAASVRGQLMERVAQASSELSAPVGSPVATHLHVLGLFSFLDALLAKPMEEIVEELALPDSMRTALLDRSGVYGEVLEFAEAMERKNQVVIGTHCTKLGIDQDALENLESEYLTIVPLPLA